MYADKDENAQLKIADFGLSKMLYGEQGNTSTVCGTPGYCGKARTACSFLLLFFWINSRVVGSLEGCLCEQHSKLSLSENVRHILKGWIPNIKRNVTSTLIGLMYLALTLIYIT